MPNIAEHLGRAEGAYLQGIKRSTRP
jgi:hypothetical protein